MHSVNLSLERILFFYGRFFQLHHPSLLMECEAAKTSHCEGQSSSVLKELTTLCEEASTSGELPSYALVISAMLFMLITAEIVMILFALWIKYIEDKWWEEQTSHQKSNTNT